MNRSCVLGFILLDGARLVGMGLAFWLCDRVLQDKSCATTVARAGGNRRRRYS